MKRREIDAGIREQYTRIKWQLKREEGLELWSISRSDMGPDSVFTKWYVSASFIGAADPTESLMGSDEKLTGALHKLKEKANEEKEK